MQSSLHHSRHVSRAIRILGSLAVLSLMLGMSGVSQATTTYSYTGSKHLTWTSNGAQTITVHRTGGGAALTVYGAIYGSPNFTLDNTIAYWPDSSKDTAFQNNQPGYFTIRFASAKPDTSI